MMQNTHDDAVTMQWWLCMSTQIVKKRLGLSRRITRQGRGGSIWNGCRLLPLKAAQVHLHATSLKRLIHKEEQPRQC